MFSIIQPVESKVDKENTEKIGDFKNSQYKKYYDMKYSPETDKNDENSKKKQSHTIYKQISYIMGYFAVYSSAFCQGLLFLQFVWERSTIVTTAHKIFEEGIYYGIYFAYCYEKNLSFWIYGENTINYI